MFLSLLLLMFVLLSTIYFFPQSTQLFMLPYKLVCLYGFFMHYHFLTDLLSYLFSIFRLIRLYFYHENLNYFITKYLIVYSIFRFPIADYNFI